MAILYGGVAALAQSKLRGMLAYASLSHVGLVVLGLASFSVSALQGALRLLLNFSVAAGSGFLVLAFLRRRTGSTDIAQLGGVTLRLPRFWRHFGGLSWARRGIRMSPRRPICCRARWRCCSCRRY